MKNKILFAVCLLSGIFAAKGLRAQGSIQFLHHADVSNITLHLSTISHPDMDGNSNLFPLFTHNFNPNSVSGKYVRVSQGIWSDNGVWRLYNEDFTPFKENSNYNVLVPGSDMESWRHEAVPSNTYSNRTFIDHPDLNKDSTAIIFISTTYIGEYSNENVGVYYSKSRKQWAIFNETGPGTPIDSGIVFNVAILKQGQSNLTAFVHTADVNNSNNNNTVLDHPYLNNNPAAMVHVTQSWNPNGAVSGIYNDNFFGVYYNGTKWAIFNEDQNSAMPTGASFNVVFVDPTISTKEYNASNNLMTIFPNPAVSSDHVTLNFKESLTDKIGIKVYNLGGVAVMAKEGFLKGNGLSYNLNISTLKPGIYIIQVESDNQIGTQKLIIQ